MDSRKEALWKLCESFIQEQDIICAETVSQTDRVIEHAYGFITDVCEIVGYKPTGED